jgi:hypothetical protein
VPPLESVELLVSSRRPSVSPAPSSFDARIPSARVASRMAASAAVVGTHGRRLMLGDPRATSITRMVQTSADPCRHGLPAHPMPEQQRRHQTHSRNE